MLESCTKILGQDKIVFTMGKYLILSRFSSNMWMFYFTFPGFSKKCSTFHYKMPQSVRILHKNSEGNGSSDGVNWFEDEEDWACNFPKSTTLTKDSTSIFGSEYLKNH